MQFIADENIPRLTVKKLRELGFDISYVSEISPGITDLAVLNLAEQENRILITMDKDFGELIYKNKVQFKTGIIYLRFVPATPVEPAFIISAMLNQNISPAGKFIVLEKDYIRERKL